MIPSVISNLIASLSIFAIAVQASPFAAAPTLEARILPEPNPESCLPPLLLCDKACCGTNSICGANGFCAPKPPPNVGQAWVTYTNDPKGRPTIINLHGKYFNTTSTMMIQQIEDSFITNIWWKDHVNTKSFDFNTGIQDCTKTGRRTAKTDGNPAHVFVRDDAFDAATHTYVWAAAIPVRVTLNGVCP